MFTIFHTLLRQIYAFPLWLLSNAAMCLPLCNRYQTPECDGAARSRVSDTEEAFQGRELQGHFTFSLQFSPIWVWEYRNFPFIIW